MVSKMLSVRRREVTRCERISLIKLFIYILYKNNYNPIVLRYYI